MNKVSVFFAQVTQLDFTGRLQGPAPARDAVSIKRAPECV